MNEHAVLDLIRKLGQREDGLFCTHRTHPALYARARRCFGTWASAVAAAGLNYGLTIQRARQRALRTRRRRLQRTRQRRSGVHFPAT